MGTTRSRRWPVARHPRAAIWLWLHARDARGSGVQRHVAGRARDRFANSRLGAVQWAWGRAERPRRRRSTVEPPRGRTPEAWAASRSGARVRTSRHQFQLRLAFFQIAKLQKVPTKLKISKKQSCRWAIDLQLSQRATYLLINGLSGNVGRSCSFSTARVTVHSAVKPIFGQFALKIGMSANYEKCVPGNNKQLLYWPILNFYSEIWRTRKKTVSVLKEI
jgi:hypothetical protein